MSVETAHVRRLVEWLPRRVGLDLEWFVVSTKVPGAMRLERLWQECRWEEARESLEEARAMCDAALEPRLDLILALAAVAGGDRRYALDIAERSSAAIDRRSDPEARALVYWVASRIMEEDRRYRLALGWMRKITATEVGAAIWHEVAERVDQLQTARLESLELARKQVSSHCSMTPSNRLERLLRTGRDLYLGDEWQDATIAFEAAAELAENLGRQTELCLALNQLACASFSMGDSEIALGVLERALRQATECEEPLQLTLLSNAASLLRDWTDTEASELLWGHVDASRQGCGDSLRTPGMLALAIETIQRMQQAA